MGAFPALALSWMTQVPTSFGAGWLMSQGKPAAFALLFLLSLAISMDMANRSNLEGGMFYGLSALLAAVLTVASYTPWMIALKKDPKSGGSKALPLSGLLFAVVTLIGSLAMASRGSGSDKFSAGLQGGLITLMYVFIAGSMGYNGAQAKTNPSAKGQTIYMLALLVLLSIFDVAGSLRETKVATNTAPNGGNKIGNQPEAPSAANLIPTAPAPANNAVPPEALKEARKKLFGIF